MALTSRLLDQPMNLVLVGDSAAGKNATLAAALALVPRRQSTPSPAAHPARSSTAPKTSATAS